MKAVQLVDAYPAHFVGVECARFGRTGSSRGFKKQQEDVLGRIAEEGYLHRREHLTLDAELFHQLALQRALWRLPGLDFAAGKLPISLQVRAFLPP